MKKLFLLVLAVLPLTLSAQTAVLVLSDTAEYSLGSSSKTFDLDKPCSRLTLTAKHTASSLTTSKTLLGNLTIEQYVNGTWSTLYEDNPGIVTTADRSVFGVTVGQYEASVDYESLSFDLDRHATQLRFTGSALDSKQIKNLCAYMASYVELSPANLSFGEMVVWSDPVSLKFAVEHCNVARLSISTSNADFALSETTVINSGIAQYATDSFTVTFTPNIMGQHSATIIVTNGTQTDSIHCSAKVTKRTPVLTWNAESMTVGETVQNPVSSDCSNRLMLESCDEDIVHIVCGTIHAVGEGTATISVMQLGDDDYWNNKVEDFTVTVSPATEPTPTAAPEHHESTDAEKLLTEGRVVVKANNKLYNL